MKINILQRLLLFSFIILAGNGSMEYAVYQGNEKLLDSERWVEHTEQVIYQSGNVLSLGKDVEIASRGFIITNDSTFLEPLYTAEKTTFAYIEQLRQLTQDNPAQQQRIDSLNFYMHKRLDFSLQMVELRSKQGLSSAIAYVSTKQGNLYSDRLRQITNAIQQEETSLLNQRKQSNERSLTTFNWFSVGMFILMTVLTIVLLIISSSYFRQNDEKEKRAAELAIANTELAFQNDEKEKRAAELVIANTELAFQNDEKEKRAAELVIANTELAFQNDEKEKRAAELAIANTELAFQNDEKEKRANELIIANKELQSFTFVSSHDLQEPLRKIQTFAKLILEKEHAVLSDKGKDYFQRMQNAAMRMQQLITDLLAFSRINTAERKFEKTDLSLLVEEVKNEFKEIIEEKYATIETIELCEAEIIPFQFRQLMQNLIGNALKFSNGQRPPHIIIRSEIAEGANLNNAYLFGQEQLSPEKNYCHITISDNGIGFDKEYKDRIFELFQRLHGKEEYAGTGIGLSIVKKIVENHNGIIIATSELDKGARFDIYIPASSDRGVGQHENKTAIIA